MFPPIARPQSLIDGWIDFAAEISAASRLWVPPSSTHSHAASRVAAASQLERALASLEAHLLAHTFLVRGGGGQIPDVTATSVAVTGCDCSHPCLLACLPPEGPTAFSRVTSLR